MLVSDDFYCFYGVFLRFFVFLIGFPPKKPADVPAMLQHPRVGVAIAQSAPADHPVVKALGSIFFLENFI